jgi:hypothetical protein
LNLTKHTGQRRLAGLTMAMAAVLVLSEALIPAAATADTGSTNTVKVLNSVTHGAITTITPVGTGGSFTVNVVANGATAISGAGAALTFDKTKLQLTGITSTAPGGATAIGASQSLPTANASGYISNISWTYFDGHTSQPANTDLGIFDATFSVIATGDNILTLDTSANGVSILGGVCPGNALPCGPGGNYGQALTVAPHDGSVVNSASVTPPTGSITALAPWLATNTVAVAWSGTPGTNPIASYDVRYRKAAYNAVMPATYTLWQNATALTTANFTTAPGTTYCFSELARDNAANVSTWTAETCTAAPLDDRSLTKSGTWSAKTGSAYYRSTYLLSTKSGSKLTRTGVKVKRLALVATTCPTCGSVKVYLGTKLLKTVSLKSTATVNKKLISVYTFSAVTSGTLSIAVSTSGKKVMIDGVVISAK